MENNARLAALKVSGYVLFAVMAFTISAYATLPWDKIKPLIEKRAKNEGVELQIDSLDSYYLTGLDMGGVQIKSLANMKSTGKDETPLLKADELRVRMGILPLLLGKKKINFSARLAGGRLNGQLVKNGKKTYLSAEMNDIILDRMTWPTYLNKELKLGGKLSGSTELDMPDPGDPGNWNGKINLLLQQGKVSSFKALGNQIPEISYCKGQVQIQITDGKANLETFRLDGPDLPINISGILTLKNPPGNTFADVSINIRPSNKIKNALPEVIKMSLNNENTYKGALGAIGKMFTSL